MKQNLITLFAVLFVFGANAQITPFEEWSSNTGSQNYFLKSKTKTDDVGSVYVAGATLNANGNYDILVSKFSSGGDHLYTYQLNGALNYHDAATALWIDGSHNVYITGFIIDSLTQASDIFVTKLNSSFVQQWTKRYNGAGSLEDMGTDIRVDGSGNVYVTGGVTNATPNSDVITIKYNSSGTQQWATVFNNTTANLNDLGARIAGITGTTIKISIVSQTAVTTYAYGLKTYSLSTGAQTATTTLGTGGSNIEEATAITQDALKNTYVVGAIDTGGSAGLNYCVIKFDSTAAIDWESYYNGADDLDDVATGIVVDDSGNVYVTGYTTTSTEATNYTTVKYGPAGNIIWDEHFNSVANGSDSGMAITLHNDTTVIITGSSFNGGTQDYYTIKYDTSGAIIWEIGWNSINNLNDGAHSIAIDTANSIVITGQSQTDSTLNYTTVKYIEADPYIPGDINSEDPGQLDYIQNKGQLLDTALNQINDVLYYNQNVYPNLFIANDRCSFLSHTTDTSVTAVDTLHRIDMRYIGSRVDAKVYPFEATEPYYNFFLPHTLNGAVGVKGSKRLLIPNLYTRVDLHYYSNNDGIKMNYIVRPGGDPTDIIFRLDSAVTTYINGNGTLTMHSILDSLTFDEPEFYQDSLGTLIPRPGGSYQATANLNEYEFDVPSYNPSYPLIIQIDLGNSSMSAAPPIGNMDWSTYVGGSSVDQYQEVRTDMDQNILACGTSWGPLFPIGPGAIIPSNPGSLRLATFSKFNRQFGTLMYSTYFGGTTTQCGFQLQDALSIACDTSNNTYVVAYTNSDNIIAMNNVGGPVLQSSNSSNLGNCRDALILSFNQFSNSIRFLTYYGGSDDDYPNTIRLDSTNHLLIGGETRSSDFPVTSLYLYPNVYYSTVGTGFLMELRSDGDTVWVTRFPGVVNDIAVDLNNNMYLTGFIEYVLRDSFPIYNPLPSQSYCDSSYNGGNTDAYIASLTGNNALSWGTFIGGDEREEGESIAYHNEEIAITGMTTSADFTPLESDPGEYIDSTWGGTGFYGWDIFISKFYSKNNKIQWSTYYGGNDEEMGYGITFDENHNLYVTGKTRSTAATFIPLNFASSFYDAVHTGGVDDAYILAFNGQNVKFWSTYLGGSVDETGTGIITTTYSQLFTVGVASSATLFPWADYIPGISWWDNTLAGGSTDGYISMFDLTGFPLAINDQVNVNQNFGIGVYPNPNNGNFNIVFDKEYRNPVKMNLYNSVGQVVYQNSVKNISSGGIVEVSANNLSTGLYILSIETEEGVFTSKVLIR